jgi:tetratricopeptide (TPR) repeat protein
MILRLIKIGLVSLAGLALIAGSTSCKRKPAITNTNHVSSTKKPLIPPGLDAPGYFNLGMDAQKHDRDEEAAEAFAAAVKLQPEYADAHLRLGLSYDALDRHDDAEGEYKTAIEQYRKKSITDPKNAVDRFNMGLAFSHLKRHDEAANAFRMAIGLDKNYAEAYFELGESLIKTARYADAINALKKAIELDPDNYQAKDALDHAMEGQQRIDSEVQQQKTAGKRNKNANTGTDGNINTGSGNSGSNGNTRPRVAPKP